MPSKPHAFNQKGEDDGAVVDRMVIMSFLSMVSSRPFEGYVRLLTSRGLRNLLYNTGPGARLSGRETN